MITKKGNAIFGFVVVVGVIAGVYFIFKDSGEDKGLYQPNIYNNYSNKERKDCSYSEPENPYSYDSGHYAGYEWAERNNVASCGGNSTSFIEGCEEYLRQVENYDVCN